MQFRERTHTQDRFLERFHIELNDEEYENLCVFVQNIDNVLFEIKRKGKSNKRLIIFNERPIWCVISKKRKRIRTVYSNSIGYDIFNKLKK